MHCATGGLIPAGAAGYGDHPAVVGRFLDAVRGFYGRVDDVVAPVLHDGPLAAWLDGRSVKSASDGRSVIAPGVLREGIVIRPAVERQVPEIGRLILKQRSPEYLARTDR